MVEYRKERIWKLKKREYKRRAWIIKRREYESILKKRYAQWLKIFWKDDTFKSNLFCQGECLKLK